MHVLDIAPCSRFPPSSIKATHMNTLWDRFQKYQLSNAELGLSLDVSRVRFTDEWLASMEPVAQKAFAAMKELEIGAIANPDEGRMVGHYWLRAPELAPTTELRDEIVNCYASIKAFAMQLHKGDRFSDVLVIGIGGSALGPQFVADALGTAEDKMRLYFFDNTDPDGMDRTLQSLAHRLDHTLCIVISKSGGTAETRNGMLEAEAAYKKAGIDFASHAVAVTGPGSQLDKYANEKGWLKRFPMWDWVGGRTSVMSAVGLVPRQVADKGVRPRVLEGHQRRARALCLDGDLGRDLIVRGLGPGPMTCVHVRGADDPFVVYRVQVVEDERDRNDRPRRAWSKHLGRLGDGLTRSASPNRMVGVRDHPNPRGKDRAAPSSSAGLATSRRNADGETQLIAPTATSPARRYERARSAERYTGTETTLARRAWTLKRSPVCSQSARRGTLAGCLPRLARHTGSCSFCWCLCRGSVPATGKPLALRPRARMR